MKILQEFRRENKISQATMAKMLKTSRSQINMTEQNKRSLPKDALERFKKLVNAEPHTVQLPVEKDFELTETEQLLGIAAKDNWNKLLNKNKYKQMVLIRKMSEMQDKFEKKIANGRSFRSAVEILPEAGAAEPEVALMELLQRESQKKLLNLGKGAQLPYQQELYLLKAEEQLLKKWVEPDTAPSIAAIIEHNTKS